MLVTPRSATRPAPSHSRDERAAFGAFTGSTTFPRLYPAFYEIAGDARSFLLTFEGRIHELVRATIPDAQPPQLRAAALDGGAVEITYRLPRRLCRLLEGLAIGTASHFGEAADVSEVSCMNRGAYACVFHIRLLPQR